MEPSKTLWMGNLEKGIEQKDIMELFNTLSKINYFNCYY